MCLKKREYLFVTLMLRDSFRFFAIITRNYCIHPPSMDPSQRENLGQIGHARPASTQVPCLPTLFSICLLCFMPQVRAERGLHWLQGRLLFFASSHAQQKTTAACYFLPGWYWNTVHGYLGINWSGDSALWLSPNVFAFKAVISV